MRKENKYRDKIGLDSTAFKVIGIVVIFVLMLFLCDPARGADAVNPNTYDYIHELIHGDYGASNPERNILVNDLDFANALIDYVNNRIDNFDSRDDKLELRLAALLELRNETIYINNSVIKAIEYFVKSHRGL